MICEVCGNPSISLALTLGDQPLPDDLKEIGDKTPCERFPIEVYFCDHCKTAQQGCRVPPEKLFHPDYHYRAAQTKDVLDGMRQFTDAVVARYGSMQGKKVLDIGCNDGSLLDFFWERGAITTGIEPTDAAREAAAKGHGIDQAFFNPRMAGYYLRTYGEPDIITFTNVFAHIEDLPRLIGCLEQIKKPDTKIIIENHYLGSVLATHQFDTFYLEHPRTYSYTSFRFIAKQLGMHVGHVEFPQRYGGNIRVYLEPGIKDDVLYTNDLDETDFGPRLKKLGEQVGTWRVNKRKELIDTYMGWGPFPAAAFPARASILLNLLDADLIIEAVYEKEGSKKIGHLVPGTAIPIKSERDFPRSLLGWPMLNLAWHIPNEIKQRWNENGYFGVMFPAVSEGDFQ